MMKREIVHRTYGFVLVFPMNFVLKNNKDGIFSAFVCDLGLNLLHVSSQMSIPGFSEKISMPPI
jgi:hypothetical protein